MVNFEQMNIDLQRLNDRLNLEKFGLHVLNKVLSNDDLNLSNQQRETLNSFREKQISIIKQVDKDFENLVIIVCSNMDDDGNPIKTFEA